MNLFRILTEKSWETSPPMDTGVTTPPQKIALFLFLAVVSIMFGLFIAAYFLRMELDDWRPMPESWILWLNTLLLFLSSIILQWSRSVLGSGTRKQFKAVLVAGGLLTLAFVYGQLHVWQLMFERGYSMYNNPANAFFYILTGIHALHILGGLWVWTRTGIKVWSGAGPEDVRLAVQLCAIYWHFLLLVWLVLFALLSYT